MAVDRLLPTEEAADLIELVRELGDAELRPRAAADERAERFPRDVFATLGKAGMLGLPYPEEYGGGGQPYEVCLQVLEEIGARWATVGVGVSVHALTCFPLVNYGTAEQRDRWLPDLLAGDLLGAYCLSEPDAGSDPGAMRTRAVRDGEHWRAGRDQGLGHPRRARGLLHDPGPDGRGLPGHQLLPGPGVDARPDRRGTGAEDGPDRLGHGHDALRRRTDRRATG